MNTLASFYALQKKDATHVLSLQKLVIDRANGNIKSFMSLAIQSGGHFSSPSN